MKLFIFLQLLLVLAATAKMYRYRQLYEWTAAGIQLFLFFLFPIIGPGLYLWKGVGRG